MWPCFSDIPTWDRIFKPFHCFTFTGLALYAEAGPFETTRPQGPGCRLPMACPLFVWLWLTTLLAFSKCLRNEGAARENSQKNCKTFPRVIYVFTLVLILIGVSTRKWEKTPVILEDRSIVGLIGIIQALNHGGRTNDRIRDSPGWLRLWKKMRLGRALGYSFGGPLHLHFLCAALRWLHLFTKYG